MGLHEHFLEPLGLPHSTSTIDGQKHTYYNVEDVPAYVDRVIPLFIGAIFLEAAVASARGRRNLLDFFETVCSLSTGLVQQVLSSVFDNVLNVALYAAVYERFRVATVDPGSLACWLGLAFGVDLGYYAFHRFSHEFHLGWIGHAVHHSGDRYNIATALRQGALSNLVSFFFYLPLALLGLPPAMFIVHKNLNLLYQFWIHTEVVGSIGPLEMVLNTPSHHRVHHRPGTNANYAGVLIIWDRLFGTFISEGGAQVDNYGLGEPTLSFDPLWMQFVTAHRTLTRLGLRAPSSAAASGTASSCGRRRSSRRCPKAGRCGSCRRRPFVRSTRAPGSAPRRARTSLSTPCSSWRSTRGTTPDPSRGAEAALTATFLLLSAHNLGTPRRRRPPRRRPRGRARRRDRRRLLHFSPAAAAAAAPPLLWLALRAAGGFERGGGEGGALDVPAKKAAARRARAQPRRRRGAKSSRASEEARRDLQPSTAARVAAAPRVDARRRRRRARE